MDLLSQALAHEFARSGHRHLLTACLSRICEGCRDTPCSASASTYALHLHLYMPCICIYICLAEAGALGQPSSTVAFRNFCHHCLGIHASHPCIADVLTYLALRTNISHDQHAPNPSHMRQTHASTCVYVDVCQKRVLCVRKRV